ncbi:MAG: hypothetical protein ABIS01_16550, partial [Ferruginibacter sp.]
PLTDYFIDGQRNYFCFPSLLFKDIGGIKNLFISGGVSTCRIFNRTIAGSGDGYTVFFCAWMEEKDKKENRRSRIGKPAHP